MLITGYTNSGEPELLIFNTEYNRFCELWNTEQLRAPYQNDSSERESQENLQTFLQMNELLIS